MSACIERSSASVSWSTRNGAATPPCWDLVQTAPGEVFVSSGGDPKEDPGHAGETVSLQHKEKYSLRS